MNAIQILILIIGGIFIFSIIYFSYINPVLKRRRKILALEIEKMKQVALKNENILKFKDSYFLISSANQDIQGPYNKALIISMLDQNLITLTTPVRKGIENQNYQPFKNFPELVEDLKDFI